MIDRIFFRQSIILAMANMKARYRDTIAGFIWVVLNPLIMFGAQSVAFKKFLRLDVPNYYLFLLGGLLPWIFLVNSLQMCTPVFEEKGPLLKSFKIQPLVVLSAQLFDNFVNFLFAFFILLSLTVISLAFVTFLAISFIDGKLNIF